MEQSVVRTRAIQVLLVEDHPMTRAGLALFVNASADLELVGEAASGEEALEFCDRTQPDVVVMDIKLPGMDGIATTRQITQRYPRVQVVAVSSFQESAMVQAALQAGAISYLAKSV